MEQILITLKLLAKLQEHGILVVKDNDIQIVFSMQSMFSTLADEELMDLLKRLGIVDE